MKTLLIFPTPVSVMPYGILYIADVFRRKQFKTRLLVNTFKIPYSHDEFIKIVKEEQPDVVCLSFATLNLISIYKLIDGIKKAIPAIVICGGPHPSSRPDEVIEYKSDIVVKGEGELITESLCDLFTDIHNKRGYIKINDKELIDGLKKINGICFRDVTGNIYHTSPQERNSNLDKLSVPDLEMLDKNAFRAIDGTLKGFNRIENGRGCPNYCTFCDRSVFGNKYVSKSPERLIQDILFLKEQYGFTDFYFTDDTFTIKPDYVLDVCDKILQNKLDITWACATRVNTVKLKLLQKMKAAGCRRVIMGIESGDNDWLKRTRKGYTNDVAIKALNIAHEAKIETHVNLMYGYPWETTEHIENQIRFVAYVKHMVDIFQTYGALIPYPNTEAFDANKDEYNLDKWWLKEKYQKCGQVIYQNAINPYAVSTFYQRNLHDDTYVYEDYFFKFSEDYKKSVRRLGFLLGRHNLKAQYEQSYVQNGYYYLGVLSRNLYEYLPNLEKKFMKNIGLKNRLHEYRKIGEFIKRN